MVFYGECRHEFQDTVVPPCQFDNQTMLKTFMTANYGFFCTQFHEVYAPYQAYATI